LFIPPNFICAFFRVRELSFGRQARGRRSAKKNLEKKISKKKSNPHPIRFDPIPTSPVRIGQFRQILTLFDSKLDLAITFA
jgi:hypothetical protein